MSQAKFTPHLITLILLTIATLILPLNTIYYGYLLEDYYYIRSYTLSEIITTFYSHWEPSLLETRGYRPLHSIHYAFFFLLIGGDPVRNHILHLTLMLIGYYLIYLLVFRCTRDTSSAFWTALIYAYLGAGAWHVPHLTNRQSLLLVIFFMASLIFYDRYLTTGRKLSWWGSMVFFLLALLLKESAVSLGPIIFFLAIIVRKKNIRSQLKPLLPFFIILIVYVPARSIIIARSHIPQVNPNPPPLTLTPGHLAYEYGRSLLSTFVQSHGVRSASIKDFPINAGGINTLRDWTAFISGLVFFALGGGWLLSRGRSRPKRAFFFGLAFLLTTTVLVAAYYRTNRLFLSSVGLAMMAGTIVSCLFSGLSAKILSRRNLIGGVVLLAFLVYFAVNIITYWEIQDALRPDGYIALMLDRWIYRDKLFLWMEEDQIDMYKRKLMQTGRLELLKQLNQALAKPTPAPPP